MIFLLKFQLSLADDSQDFYTAAVLEFSPPGTIYTTPKEIVDHNLEEYLVTIENASKHGVQILVFSEATLNYNGITSRAGIVEFAVQLDEKVGRESGCDYGSSPVSFIRLLIKKGDDLENLPTFNKNLDS
jgi:hypothetical protein